MELEMPNKLSPRELDILKAMARGLSNQQIADELGIAERTVRTHAAHIFSKMYVSSRTEAVLKAQWLGLVDRVNTLSPIAQTIALLLTIQPDALDELGLCRDEQRNQGLRSRTD